MAGIIVIGGGAIGCSIAYFLARDGGDVVLVERGELAGEATGASAGMLAALSDEGGDRGPAFQKLCMDGLSLYHEIMPELEATGVDLRYRASGVLHVALTDDEAAHLRHRYDTQRTMAPSIEWLDPEALRRAEPEISKNAVAGLISPDEHYLDAKRLTAALAEAAQAHGARIETNTTVLGFVHRGPALTGVRTQNGVIDAGAVVLAGGPWTAALARRLGARVPVVPIRGQMMSLLGPGQPLRRVVWGHKGYLVPREDGQTFVGASVEHVGFRKTTTLSALRVLRRAAAALVPGLATAPEASHWAGLRPGSPDGLPMLGLLPGWDNAWVATGHFRNGILLSPITGKLLASSVLAGRPAADLKPFSLERFLD